MAKQQEPNHLEEMQELQLHRLNPRYYTGEKLPPMPRGKIWLAGFFFLGLGALMLLGWFAILFNRNPNNRFATIIGLVLLGIMILLNILAGIAYFYRHMRNKKINEIDHKRL